MFGIALATVQSGLPSVLGESSKAARGLLSDIVRQGAEDGSFAPSPTGTKELDVAVLSAWSLVHGLTMLLIDGLASTETPLNPVAENVSSDTATEQIAEQVIQFLLDGISSQQKAPRHVLPVP